MHTSMKFLAVALILVGLTSTTALAEDFASVPEPTSAAGVSGFANKRLQLAHQLDAYHHRHHHAFHVRQQRRRAAAAAAAEAAAAATTSSSPTPAPSPQTPSTTAYSGGCLSDAQVTSYLLEAGFPSSAIPTMLFYSHRESGNCPGAINSSSGACGLFQIYVCPGSWALDPLANAKLAYAKYRASGFSPWGG